MITLHPRTIPLQYHFAGLNITAEEYTRLGSNLHSWDHLNELLVLGVFTIAELKKLLILELHGTCRKQVLTKLRSRILTAESKHIQQIISYAMSPTPAREALPSPTVRKRDRRHRRFRKIGKTR